MEKQQLRQRRTCDIVMKGGITSGVVYPKAIAKIAGRFTFKNIGGTSAGAIAAAAAAAAEYHRVRTGSSDGFNDINTLGDDLSAKPNGSSETMLFSLFAPNSGTKRVFRVLTGLLGDKSIAKKSFVTVSRAYRQYFLAPILGMLPGIALALFSFYSSAIPAIMWIWTVVGILLGLFGGFVAVTLSLLYEFVTSLPANNFGLCNGMLDAKSGKKAIVEPLTVWLTGYLNKTARIESDKPLTFGDLWNPKGNTNQGAVREINLEMMTTNLTHGRPYRLPFRYDDDLKENHLFYFRKDEFEVLFPKTVVDWMLDNPRKIGPDSDPNGERALERAERAKAGYYPLPDPEDLPVVVATRMSLSFPVLLSVIPLHAIDRTRDKKYQRLERCWFTDGGACSNFPLHFFDSPLPRRPTFSIDLTAKPNGTSEDGLAPNMDDYNYFELTDRWNRFDLNVEADESEIPSEKGSLGKLLGFAGTLISSMQNWNDATQSRLPGYRDRIVRIPLTSEQGGLNLDMPQERIEFLGNQGIKCAERLLEHFDVPSSHQKMTWENHRWIRVRAMFAAFEKMIDEALTGCDHPENGDQSYEAWLNGLLVDTTGKYKKLSYDPSKSQLDAAIKTIAKMREIKQLWHAAGTAAKNSPRPRPSMRPRAQI
ncbi:MAG: patatin-like phospholipase family protein [Acidobacteria bacterium]|nr:patatin-like phospholipase family protein [Acidobacteriota bacterium]